MSTSALGKIYQPDEIIFRQGDDGDWMYVVLEGKVEIFLERSGEQIPLKLCREGDLLGEMAIFNREPRSATARSQGVSRLLTIDKRNFMRRIQEDPTIAFRLVQELCTRIQELNEDVLLLNRTIQECMKDRIEN